MKKTMKWFPRMLSVILSVILLVQAVPMGVVAVSAVPAGQLTAQKSADEGTVLGGPAGVPELTEEQAAVAGKDSSDVDENTQKEETLILGEVESLRKENTKYFRHADGTFTSAVYAEPVHYEDANGKWQDIDNTLQAKTIEGKTVYEPVATGVDIRIPQKFEGQQELSVSKDEHTVGLSVSAENVDVQLSKSASVVDVDQLESEKRTANLTVAEANDAASSDSRSSRKVDDSKIKLEQIREANEEKLELENLTSAVTYRDIFPGADLEYIVTPGKIKENIVVKEAQDTYIYKFDFALGGLITVPQENGSIYLLENADDEKPLFVLQAPFMYDAANEESTSLTMTFAEDGTLVLTADAVWINDEARVFPVVIDPTITTYASGFQDAYISNALLSKGTNYSSATLNYAGKGLLGTRRTYIKFTLPTLPESSVVNQALFGIAQHSCDYYSSGNYMYLFDLTGKNSWTESGVKWNAQPVSQDVNGPRNDGTKILDYQPVNSGSNVSYTFNITRAVKNWYETSGSNNGLMLTTSDESADTQACLYSARSANVPVVQVWYSTNVGLEDYWSYETVDLGRSGTAYVNDQNGSLTYIHSDLSMNGNRLPISIAHINTTNRDNASGTYLSMKLGVGFRLNIMEQFIAISSSDALYASPNNYRYKFIDGDGTTHYYKQQTVGGVSKITYEYDPLLVLVKNTDNTYTLTDSQNNKSFYNTSGYLYKFQDNNGNAQNITWSGNRITQVTDPANRAVTFSYDSSNRLTAITDPANRAITYSYDTSDQLTGITYPDGKTTTFQYNASKISRVTAYDTSYILLSYKTVYPSRYRVSYLYQYDKAGTQVDYLQFLYSTSNASGKASGNTVVKNKLAKEKVFLFNPVGHVLNVTNQDEQTQYSVYGSSTSAPNEFNKPIANSELQTISNNLLKNHGFEQSANWSLLQSTTAGSCVYTTADQYRGTRSLKAQLTDSTGVFEIDQDFTAQAGQTYTVSVDIKIPEDLAITSNNGVFFGFVYQINGGWYTDGSEWIATTYKGWQRFTHTMTLPSGTLNNIHVFMEIARTPGIVYFDNIQVEKSGGARYYNLIENSEFSQYAGDLNSNSSGATATSWTMANTSGADGVKYNSNQAKNEVCMVGTPASQKKISQSVPVNAQAGDILIIGGKAGAYASGADNDSRLFSIRADIYSSASTYVTTIPIDFDRSITQEHQVAAKYVVLNVPCHHIVYTFCFYNQIGNVAFSKAFIYVGNYGERNSYDSSGRLTKAVNDDEYKSTEYTYSNNDVVSIDETINGTERNVAELEYDTNHNPIQITNSTGTEVDITYLNGQVASQTTTDTATGKTLTETMTYVQDGNYLKTKTDANGSVTTYYYDNNDNPQKGLVVKVKDPNNNETTYAYNANTDELLSTTGKSNATTSVATNFTSQDYLPKTIVRNGTTYTYDYDNQNRVTAAKVGTQTLVTNSYDSRRRLSQQTFANGATYQPVYDSRDRTVGEKWNGTQIVKYSYNENDRLSQMVDSTGSSSITYKYDYAFLGLVNKITGSDGTQTLYDYDMSGALVDLKFKKNNEIIHEARYHRNEKGYQEDNILTSLDNTAQHFNYDGLGRLTGQSVGPLVSSRTYLGTGNATTNRIGEFENENRDTTLQQYGYTYDAIGNISAITEAVANTTTSYTYDGLNRLVSETGPAGSYAYNYDVGGNLSSVVQGGTAVHSYTYGNTNWKDRLTALDGETITYDTNGNPLTFAGYTFTWQRGRQLASFSGNGLSITYAYDASGNRTKQVANGTTINYLYSGNMLMRQSDGTNTLDFAYDANGKAVGFKYNGTSYLYVRNLQGDVVTITDAEGTVVASYTYDAYGNITAYSGAMASINPIRYRGYYQDPHTGWYFLNTRYYNPDWRRFLNSDALFIAGGDSISGSNMYAYCNGNPVMYSDPSGMGPILDWIRNGINKIADTIDRAASAAYGWAHDKVSQAASAVIGKWFGPKVEWLIGKTQYTIGIITNTLFGLWLKPWYEKDYPFDGKKLFGIIPLQLRPLYSYIQKEFLPIQTQIGAWFLDFHKDADWNSPNYGNYRTLPGSYQWQKHVGYYWYYDFFFNLGGPIDKKRYIFNVDDGGFSFFGQPDVQYVVWCWKADYWNLGAGAEIGIYYQDNPIRMVAGYYEIDTEHLLVHALMNVTYKGEPLTTNFEQTNWWITSFTPRIQNATEMDQLNVEFKVKFEGNNNPQLGIDHSNLYAPFYAKWNPEILVGRGDGLSWLPSPWQFKINY